MVTQEELEKMSPEEIAELQKQNCIFCKLIKGEIPAKKVYEDDKVLAILDINPGRKGHVLVMPKEHFPILPVIPPDIFKSLFSATKIIAQGMRKAMLVDETTIFLANGAIAGQQSPHFLFHIFPRDKSDGLTNFDLKENPALKQEQESLKSALENNLNIMLSKIVPQSGNAPVNPNASPEEIAKQNFEKKQEVISQILEQHDDVREVLINDPELFKEQLSTNPQLEKLFEGIDIYALSEKLKQVSSPESETKTKIEKAPEGPQIEEVKEVVEESSTDLENIVSPPKEEKTPEVFLGEDPIAQRDSIFKYFESKPKAKQLLIDDPKHFMELLDKRPDVKELFVDVDINKLSIKLKELEESENE